MKKYAATDGRFFYGHGWPVRRKCRSIFRRVPEWPDIVKRDGVYAGNAEAISGGRLNRTTS
jgi:hypothetical protein